MQLIKIIKIRNENKYILSSFPQYIPDPLSRFPHGGKTGIQLYLSGS
jgi:hypothetical protein